jgi:hypothetical protein
MHINSNSARANLYLCDNVKISKCDLNRNAEGFESRPIQVSFDALMQG